LVVVGLALLLIAGDGVAQHAGHAESIVAECVECHGADGLKTANGAPYLAGQNANYLAAAMRAYAKGQRNHAPMQDIAKTLEEPKILALAELYAGLKGNWRGAARGSGQASRPSEETIAAGRDAAKPCFSCHGAEGNSARAGVPSIAGLQPAYFSQAARAYFSGDRVDPLMATFKEALSDQEIEQLAAYFATLTRQKPAPAATGNIKAGAQAAQNCVGCHGRDGNSGVAEFPSVTGLDPAYFAKAMREYRDGKRKNEHMLRATRKMSDATIENLAAYFATREPKPFPLAAAPRGEKFDPVGDGERVAQSCVGCHGDATNPPQSATPRLSGLHERYLATSIAAYRGNARRHELMKTFVARLSDLDIEKVALYFAVQPPAIANARANAVAADAAAAASCAGCHGDGGNSTNPDVPSLSGQDPAYLALAIESYRSGARDHEDMRKAVAELNPESAAALAHFFNRQTPVAATVRMPEAPTELAAKCNRCHGERGYSTEPGKPRLAGQSETYLLRALREYKHQQRQSTAMHAMADVLSEIELRAIAAYYARN
jgi:cytochrome c553